MPKNAKNHVYKEKEFNIYVMWKFLPAHVRGIKKNELINLGLTDPLILKIIKIKSQTEFAKYFHIKDLGTLTDWNNKIKKESITPPPLMNEYQKQNNNINEKIIVPNITNLNEKILNQKKIISSLKKENTILKNKIKSRVSNTKVKITNKNLSTSFEMIPRTKPDIILLEEKVSKTIFQKIKNIFTPKQ